MRLLYAVGGGQKSPPLLLIKRRYFGLVFSSIPFLYYFLPAVLIIYFIAPKQLKNAVLLLSSLVFYAWGEPKYVFLMLVSIACGYIFGLLIEKSRSSAKKAKLFLGISVAISLGFLLYFKYTDFFILIQHLSVLLKSLNLLALLPLF